MAAQAATKTITAADRPEGLLGREPQIDSDDGQERALLELGFMRAHAASVRAALAHAVAQLEEAAAAQLAVAFGETSVSYAERESQLTAAIEAYTRASRPELKTDGKVKKSHAYRNGTVGWVKARDAVAYQKGCSLGDVRAAIDKRTHILDALRDVLKNTVLFRRRKAEQHVKLSDVADVELRIAVSGLLRAKKQCQLTATELRALRLRFAAGEDQFFVEPTPFGPL